MEVGGLQLLPGTKKRLGIKVPGENRFLYIGSAILGATLVTMFALLRYQASLVDQRDQLNKEIANLEDKRNKNDEQDLFLARDRLVATSDLVRNHVYWTQVFSWLESVLQKEIQVRSFSKNNDGRIIISATASSYVIVARQVAIFLADSKVLDLGLGKIESGSDGGIKFDVQLTLDLDNLLKKK